MKKWIPNFLTGVRLGIALWFPFVPESYWVAVIAIAAFTEWGDGFFARKFQAESQFGRLFDPIADKFLFCTVLLTLIHLDIISWWHLIVLGLRDLTVLSGVLWLLYRRDSLAMATFAPRRSGKWATGFQYAYFFSLIIVHSSNPVVFAATAIVGAWASWEYITWFIHWRCQPLSPNGESGS